MSIVILLILSTTSTIVTIFVVLGLIGAVRFNDFTYVVLHLILLGYTISFLWELYNGR